MTQTQTRAIVRHLGGETGHRSFFGGTHSKTRLALLGLVIALRTSRARVAEP